MSLDDGLAYSQKLLQMTEEQYNAYIVKWQEKQAAAQRVAAQFYQDPAHDTPERFYRSAA